jgi:hypothetical protein
MNKLLLALALVAFLTPSLTYAHGGGCRKDSPQGQCCHAGSEPYHCH